MPITPFIGVRICGSCGEEFALGLRGGLGGFPSASRSSTVRSATSCSSSRAGTRLPREIPFFGERGGDVAGPHVVEGFLRITSLSDWPSFSPI